MPDGRFSIIQMNVIYGTMRKYLCTFASGITIALTLPGEATLA